jgi:hypothetical protein
MSEPTRSRTGMAFISNPVEQWRQLGVTNDNETVERYVLAAHKERLASFESILRARRKRRRVK